MRRPDLAGDEAEDGVAHFHSAAQVAELVGAGAELEVVGGQDGMECGEVDPVAEQAWGVGEPGEQRPERVAGRRWSEVGFPEPAGGDVEQGGGGRELGGGDVPGAGERLR